MSFSGRNKRAASRSCIKVDSPLNRLRLQANLTVTDLARQFRVSTAAVSRWLSGERSSPEPFARFLHRAAPGDPSEIATAQENFRQLRRRSLPSLPIELALPAGMSTEQAKAICVRALADLAEALSAVSAMAGSIFLPSGSMLGLERKGRGFHLRLPDETEVTDSLRAKVAETHICKPTSQSHLKGEYP